MSGIKNSHRAVVWYTESICSLFCVFENSILWLWALSLIYTIYLNFISTFSYYSVTTLPLISQSWRFCSACEYWENLLLNPLHNILFVICFKSPQCILSDCSESLKQASMGPGDSSSGRVRVWVTMHGDLGLNDSVIWENTRGSSMGAGAVLWPLLLSLSVSVTVWKQKSSRSSMITHA